MPIMLPRGKMEREVVSVDVLVVGAGPAGLTAAIALKKAQPSLEIWVLEKGQQVGSQQLSGALFDPIALQELFPNDWQQAPLGPVVTQQKLYWLTSEQHHLSWPHWLAPAQLDHRDQRLIYLDELCQWLAKQAEKLGITIYSGFCVQQLIIQDDGVKGGITGDQGLDRHGQAKPHYAQGMAIMARYTLLAEGARGHLAKTAIDHFKLANPTQPQHYAIGFKELWQMPKGRLQAGVVHHGAGWPLAKSQSHGGFFAYQLTNDKLAVGLVLDLNYRNSYLDPFAEFQRLKHHPLLANLLAGGQRIGFGARTLCKGGWHSLPTLNFPGGWLLGCDAGTLDSARLQGIHGAMKSAMLAAAQISDEINSPCAFPLAQQKSHTLLSASWLGLQLKSARNYQAALHRLGIVGGSLFNLLESRVLGLASPFTLLDKQPDHHLAPLRSSQTIAYPQPDGLLSFDKMSSLYLARLSHEEDQPCHINALSHSEECINSQAQWAMPALRYCPAGVFQLAPNGSYTAPLPTHPHHCLHCKCCDIKDPSQQTQWQAPEGGSGPYYINL